MSVTIWHNPSCATSRNTLAMIRATGAEPVVVEYLKQRPQRDAIASVAALVGGARALLRLKGTPAVDLGLNDEGVGDEAIIDAMARDPLLINRPVVFGPRGTVLARPSERVLDVLDGALPSGFTKEDGAPVLGA